MWIRIVTIVLLFSVTLFAKPGDLDLSFGGDGIVTTEIGSDNDVAQGVVIQSDGKIVTAGYSWNGSDKNFALARYNPDGSLDESFDGDGIVTTAIGNYWDAAYSVTVQNDGKIVVAGYSDNGNNYDFALVRYNTDGSLDESFDDDGIVTTEIGNGYDEAYSVAIQSDGKIIVAGYSNNGSNDDFAIVRYNPDGSLDESFDGDGKVTTAVGNSDDYAMSVDIQSDRKIVVAGTSWNGIKYDFALARYSPDGSLDESFNDDGMVTTVIGSGADSGQSVVIQSNGKIVVAGSSKADTSTGFALVRYNPNGSLDTSFGSGGIVTTEIGSDYDKGYSMVIQNNGKIIVAGVSRNGVYSDFALVRYNPDGSLDETLGSGGIVTTTVGTIDQANSVAIQSDGKIVVAGSTYSSDTDFLLVRYEGGSMVLSPIYYLLQ